MFVAACSGERYSLVNYSCCHDISPQIRYAFSFLSFSSANNNVNHHNANNKGR